MACVVCCWCLQVAVLEAERVKMTRALVREVGEEVPLARLLDEGSDWKGRREQVITLQNKIKALKEQLVGGGYTWARLVLRARDADDV